MACDSPTSKELRSGTHKQTNLGYAKLVAQHAVLNGMRALRAQEGESSTAPQEEKEEELSAYELQRQDEIRANRDKLIELGLLSES